MANRTPWRSALLVFLACLSSLVRADPPASQPAAVREAFLKIIDRPRVDPAPEEQPPVTLAPGLDEIQFSYATDAQQRVPGLLVKQSATTGRRPTVIMMHGTGGKKEGELGLLKQYAGKGFIAVAIDGRYHGERAKYGEYNAQIAHAFAEGGEHPLYYDTVWDAMRLIDYLQSRPDVDPARIGLMGFSKGGIETYFTAAVDPRVAVAVPCIGVQSFGWALEHDGWHGRVGTFSKAFTASFKQAGPRCPRHLRPVRRPGHADPHHPAPAAGDQRR